MVTTAGAVSVGLRPNFVLGGEAMNGKWSTVWLSESAWAVVECSGVALWIGDFCGLAVASASDRTFAKSLLLSAEEEEEGCRFMGSVALLLLPFDEDVTDFENVVFVLLVEVVGVDFDTLKARLLKDMLHG